jgi:hypothetical protein
MRGRQTGRGRTDGAKPERESDVGQGRAAWAARAAASPSERVRGTSAAVAATAARPQRRPKPKRRLPPEVLTDEEVRALLDACGRYTPVALRNRALITLMYRAGLRVSEALALAAQGRGPRERDRPRPAREGRPVPGRGPRPRRGGRRGGLARRTRQGPTGGGTGERGRRPSTRPLAAAPLLCTAYGTPVTTGYVRRLMKRLGAKPGSPSASTPTVCGTRTPPNCVRGRRGRRCRDHLPPTRAPVAAHHDPLPRPRPADGGGGPDGHRCAERGPRGPAPRARSGHRLLRVGGRRRWAGPRSRSAGDGGRRDRIGRLRPPLTPTTVQLTGVVDATGGRVWKLIPDLSHCGANA